LLAEPENEETVVIRLRTAVTACVAAGALVALSLPAAATAGPVGTGGVCFHFAVAPEADFCVNPTVGVTDPCLANPTLPGCVNDVFDKAVWAVEMGRAVYNNDVQPIADRAVCQVYTLLTGKPCPHVPTL
jgi:hypothetical protein